MSSLPPDQERAEAIGEQLRAKIASKFTASTFLGGFALTILAGQVFAIWQTSRLSLLFPQSVAVVVAAVILFFEAVVRLDELTMPKRFWPTNVDAEPAFGRSTWGLLTDGDLEALEEKMRFFWTRFTLVATCLTAVAVLMVLFPMETGPEHARRWTMAYVAIGIIGALWYARRTTAQADASPRRFIRPVD
jgi:hypothetical protein